MRPLATSRRSRSNLVSSSSSFEASVASALRMPSRRAARRSARAASSSCRSPLVAKFAQPAKTGTARSWTIVSTACTMDDFIALGSAAL